MHMVYKTSYCLWIHVCASFLVPYDASVYRFLWHFFCTLFMKWCVCIPKTNQGVPFVFGLHTNVYVQILLVHRFPHKTAWYSLWTLQPWQSVKSMLLAHPRMRLQSSPLGSFYLIMLLISYPKESYQYPFWNEIDAVDDAAFQNIRVLQSQILFHSRKVIESSPLERRKII